MDIVEFKKRIKIVRSKIVPRPKTLVNEVLRALPYYEKDKKYFLDNANQILYDLRAECWKRYLKYERIFNIKMGEVLIKNDPDFKDKKSGNPDEIIGEFLEKYSNHLFELSKSNTNSRRARAGKEFEAIIETILLRAGICFDNQGIIGSKLFETDRLGKLVDCVVPGVVEYTLEKRKCALISMKTTLRERWQEVPEEMKRTGAQEMFLLTLDNGISKNTIESLASHNITLVVPDDIKNKYYRNYLNIYGLEKFLKELIERNRSWFERNDLSKDYYRDKLKTVSERIKESSDPYEIKMLKAYEIFFKKYS